MRDAFLSALPAPSVERWARHEALDVELEHALEEARARWAGIVVAPEVFAAYVGARIQPEQGVGAAAFRHTTDLYLACAVSARQAEAIRAFEREYVSKLSVARFRLSPEELDDIKQRVRQQCLMGDPPKIVDFSGWGGLSAWLRVAAVRAAIKLRKPHPEDVDDDALARVPGLDPGAELTFLRAEQRTLLRDSLRQAIASLEPQEQNVLRQHYLDGLTLDQLAALYHVHRTTAAYWIERARGRLLKRTRQAIMKTTRMSASDCDSLLRQAQSDFASTMTSLFR